MRVSPGWGLFKLGADCAATPVLVGTVPNGTVIPARGHYLFTGGGYNLNSDLKSYATGDQSLTADIESDRNVALFTTANLLNLSSATRLDAAGLGTNTGNNCDLLREGTTLPGAAGSLSQHSYVRKTILAGGVPNTGRPQDTNNNAADFLLVSTTPATPVGSNTAPVLGAPGPENLASPIQRNAQLRATLLDPAQGPAASANRHRYSCEHRQTSCL